MNGKFLQLKTYVRHLAVNFRTYTGENLTVKIVFFFVSSLTSILPFLYTFRNCIFCLTFSLVYFSTCLLSSHCHYSPPSFLPLRYVSVMIRITLTDHSETMPESSASARHFKHTQTGFCNYKCGSMYIRYRKTNINRLMRSDE
jgi:hypothetical protein